MKSVINKSILLVLAAIFMLVPLNIVYAEDADQTLYSEDFQSCTDVSNVSGIQNLSAATSGIITEGGNKYLKGAKKGSTAFACELVLDTPIRIGKGTMPTGMADPGHPGNNAVIEVQYDIKALPDTTSGLGSIIINGKRPNGDNREIASTYFYGGAGYTDDLSGKQTFTYGKPSTVSGEPKIPSGFENKFISSNVISDTWYTVKIVIPVTDIAGNYITGQNNIDVYLDGKLTAITNAPYHFTSCVAIDRIKVSALINANEANIDSKGLSLDNITVKVVHPKALKFSNPIFTQREMKRGEIVCNFPYSNTYGEEKEVILVTALYENNKLIKVNNIKQKVAPNSSGFLYSHDTVGVAEGRIMKAFVLNDMGTLTPFSAAARLESNSLPNVLLLGDSISIGYTPFVQSNLSGIADVYRPYTNGTVPVNCADTGSYLTYLENWLSLVDKWDVIYFNAGLHDIKYVDKVTKKEITDLTVDPATCEHRTSIEKYEDNLNKIVSRLKSTGAELVFATITPIPAGTTPMRIPQDVDIYNAVAKKVMNEQGVTISDLHELVKDDLDTIQYPVDVHFTNSGYQLMADAISVTIKEKLGLLN